MLPRAGGNVPWGIGRLDRTVERMPELAQANRPATQYLRRFYYDCIIESPQIVTSLIQLVGADRVLFGTDYPSPMRDENPTAFIENLTLSRAERDLILGGNAARLFRL
jgi:aminocarboxymuconate-semialdehyde decarboxylase